MLPLAEPRLKIQFEQIDDVRASDLQPLSIGQRRLVKPVRRIFHLLERVVCGKHHRCTHYFKCALGRRIAEIDAGRDVKVVEKYSPSGSLPV